MLFVQPNKEDDGVFKLKFLPKVAQEIIDEFALKYAVEPIFRMMVYVFLHVDNMYVFVCTSTS